MDGGYVVLEGTAEQVIGNPQSERTKSFMFRVFNPTQVEEGDEFLTAAVATGPTEVERLNIALDTNFIRWPGG